MANYTNLNDLFTDMANAIRTKKDSTDAIVADNFPEEIESIRTGFDYNNANITVMPDYAFYNCEDLNNVDCVNLTSVGKSAFENCKNLESVILYEGVESVGENAFKKCDNLIIRYDPLDIPEIWHENWNPDNRPVVCGDLVQTWDVSATEDDDVTAYLCSVGDENVLFIYGNGNMKNYYHGYNYAPWEYKDVTKVIIGRGVTSIGEYAFNYCTSLTSIAIPDSVTSIGDSAFLDCKSLTSITIPDSVTSICKYAFSSCDNLTSINIPNGIIKIDNSVFRGCTSLISINIPDSVTSIGDSAFENCSSLTSVTIPDSVTSIGDNAFYNIAYDSDASNWENDVLYIGNHLIKANNTVSGEYEIRSGTKTIGGRAFNNCKNITSIIIPNSVVGIGAVAFNYCTSLTSIVVPDSVTNIGSNAFIGTPWLATKQKENPLVVVNNILVDGKTCFGAVEIPDSIVSIADKAFYYCKNITSVDIPSSINNIGSETFVACTNLNFITIPNSIAIIGSYAFNGCNNLASIVYTGTIAQWEAINFGDSWNYSTGNYTIHCTDGDIAKDGTITYHNA